MDFAAELQNPPTLLPDWIIQPDVKTALIATRVIRPDVKNGLNCSRLRAIPDGRVLRSGVTGQRSQVIGADEADEVGNDSIARSQRRQP